MLLQLCMAITTTPGFSCTPFLCLDRLLFPEKSLIVCAESMPVEFPRKICFSSVMPTKCRALFLYPSEDSFFLTVLVAAAVVLACINASFFVLPACASLGPELPGSLSQRVTEDGPLPANSSMVGSGSGVKTLLFLCSVSSLFCSSFSCLYHSLYTHTHTQSGHKHGPFCKLSLTILCDCNSLRGSRTSSPKAVLAVFALALHQTLTSRPLGPDARYF